MAHGVAPGVDITAAIQSVLGLEKRTDANAIFARLSVAQQQKNNAVALTYFCDLIPSLPDITVDEHNKVLLSRGRKHAEKGNVVGKGTYGECFKTADGAHVYKQITIAAVDKYTLEKEVRGVFLETCIQAILAADPEVGAHICKPIRLYRDSKMTRGKVTYADKVILYIQMEPVMYGLSDYMEALQVVKGGAPLDLADVSNIFIDLGETLSKLQRTYGFYHGDLHTGNVMVAEDGTLKLIDFGFSCMKLGATIYKHVETETTGRIECMSYDCLMFLTSLLEFEGHYLSDEAIGRLKSMFEIPDDDSIPEKYRSRNLYRLLESRAEKADIQVFHLTYYDQMRDWLHPLVQSISEFVDPDMFAFAFTDVVPVAVAPAMSKPVPVSAAPAAPNGVVGAAAASGAASAYSSGFGIGGRRRRQTRRRGIQRRRKTRVRRSRNACGKN